MAKTKSGPTQAELRAFRTKWAKLRAKGLVKNDARSQKMTKHAKSQLRKFADVLDGKAVVVTVPKNHSKDYEGKFPRAGNKIVVPKPALGGTVRFVASEGEIVSSAKVPGGTVRSRFRRYSMAELKKMEGKNISFSVYVDRGTYYEVWRKKTVAELEALFSNGSWRWR